MAFIFQDSSGVDHAISNNDTFCKALGLPMSNRQVIMTDESGQLVSVGNTAGQLDHNGNLIKALRASEPLAKAMPTNGVATQGKDIFAGKRMLFGKGTSFPSLKKSHTLAKSEPLVKSHGRHDSVLSMLDELQSLKDAYGIEARA